MSKRPRDTDAEGEAPKPVSSLAALLAKTSASKGRGVGRGMKIVGGTAAAGVTREQLPKEAQAYLAKVALGVSREQKPVDHREEDEAAFLSFNKELFIAQEWEIIRSEFYTVFQNHFQLGKDESQNPILLKYALPSQQKSTSSSSSSSKLSRPYSDQIREPKKFWRHCREQLAKWNLSQKAREPFTSELAARSSHYLPGGRGEDDQVSTLGLDLLQRLPQTTFDDQLIRDLSLKCRLASRVGAGRPDSASSNEPERVPLTGELELQRNKDIAEFVKLFRLDIRCQLAHARVAQAVSLIKSNAEALAACNNEERASKLLSTFVQSCIALGVETQVGGETQGASGGVGRIAGGEVNITVKWSSGSDLTRAGATSWQAAGTGGGGLVQSAGDSEKEKRTDPVATPQLKKLFARFSSPLTAWNKLQLTYRGDYFVSPFEIEAEGNSSRPVLLHKEDVILRSVTLLTRYEVNLCSGSLQLCADESLKRTLEEKHGYRVADLCASPINCWTLTDTAAETPTLQKPNVYCSAFYDTDRWFGSLGSALHLDYEKFVKVFCSQFSPASESSVVEWVLTLDVPYDEDLCELLFLKLAEDMKSGKLSIPGRSSGRCPVSFIGVLPLWWDLDFSHTPKVLARNHKDSDDEADTTPQATKEENAALMKKAVDQGAAYLTEGHQIGRQWMATLGETSWAAFDAVFVKDGYSYYCSSTNKMLEGVTATEVLAFEDPSGQSADDGCNKKLSTILKQYYKV